MPDYESMYELNLEVGEQLSGGGVAQRTSVLLSVSAECAVAADTFGSEGTDALALSVVKRRKPC